MHLQLASRPDVDRALGLAGWLNRPGVRDVDLSLAGLDPAQRAQRAELIRRLFNDCGCAAGTVAFLAAAALALVIRVAGSGWDWRSLGLAAGAGVGAAVAGKLGGLAWSRHRLRTELRRLGALSSTF